MSWLLKKEAESFNLDRWLSLLLISDVFLSPHGLVMLLMGLLKLTLTYTPACMFSGNTSMNAWHSWKSAISACQRIISSHKVSNEITSTAGETEQANSSRLWISLTALILFHLTWICPLCVGLVFSARFCPPGKLVSYLINHHECAWHTVGACY